MTVRKMLDVVIDAFNITYLLFFFYLEMIIDHILVVALSMIHRTEVSEVGQQHRQDVCAAEDMWVDSESIILGLDRTVERDPE